MLDVAPPSKSRTRGPSIRAVSARVSALEKRMTHVEATTQTAADKATEAAKNTAELLAFVKATKGTAAFFKKHGPRMVAFGTGLLSAAGLGSPSILKFIASFFA